MRKIWLLVLIVTLIGCSYNKKKTLKKELEMLYSSTIELVVDSLFNYSYNYPDSVLFDNSYKTLVVYYDSLTCGICETRKLSSWQSFLLSIDTLECYMPFNVFFIFTPPMNQSTPLKIMLKNVDIDYPVIIDEKRFFSNNNKHIPQNPLMHTFLLDENCRVLLVGDILYNTNVRNLFLNKIRTVEK